MYLATFVALLVGAAAMIPNGDPVEKLLRAAVSLAVYGLGVVMGLPIGKRIGSEKEP